MLKKYDIPFDELFTSKEHAVYLFLSTEERLLDLTKRYNDLKNSGCPDCGARLMKGEYE